MRKIRYRILDGKNNVVCCCLRDSEIKMLPDVRESSRKVGDTKTRAGVCKNNYGVVYAFTCDKEYVRSSRKFKTTIEILANSLSLVDEVVEGVRQQNNRNTSRLVHNLTSLNAHNIQEVHSLIPQDGVSKKMGDQISLVEGIVKDEPRETALVLLRVAKNNAAMKTEFSVFGKLFESNPELRVQSHNVHKVLMNVFYLFFPDFTDKGVKVLVSPSQDTANFDYESIHVALYHIIENSSKYVKPDTELKVDIKEDQDFILVSMDMISTQIRLDEKDLIFDEGFSGSLSHKTGKAGGGIGMNMVRKLVNINHGSITVTPFCDTCFLTMGVAYQRNVFELRLPIKRVK